MLTNGVYGMSAITALTAQNTEGVYGIRDVTPEFLERQIDAVCTDIFPDAVKIGMVSSVGLIEVIAEAIEKYKLTNIVLDPVMVATSGARLIEDNAVEALTERLIPLADIITPNIPEAEILSNITISDTEDMVKAAKIINNRYNCAVLCKGGHSIGDANDVLYSDNKEKWFLGERVDNTNTHGTGCTLSSAIASNLAKGYSMEVSVDKAKKYITNALKDMLNLGKGSGPLNHGFAIKSL
ncbi:MAG: bifunctional hydroxymethylpyrimidine kinase/phosphomethylpyrimidine kinase, partial [Coprococcus sp.]